MPFSLTEDQLRNLFESANFVVPAGEMIFFGLRGCSPVDDGGTAFAAAQSLEVLRPDYLHMNCTLGQWLPGSGFAVFPGSTVPYLDDVKTAMAAGGAGVNQLASGYYHGAHGYAKGMHKAGIPMSAHRAFRNTSILPVWRTADDADYEGDDHFETSAVIDNIHCGYQMNPSLPKYSSNGCQVVGGLPQIAAKGWKIEQGPWAKFIANAYGRQQTYFSYALFLGVEAAKIAQLTLPDRPQTVRFGSNGALVAEVQKALIKKGYELGPAGADGDFGLSTAKALQQFQFKTFGAGGTDLVVGAATATALGLAWPGAKVVASTTSLDAVPATQPGVYSAKYNCTFRSLVPGGFFSSDPDDLSVHRSIRTNNPGAMDITKWQQAFPGFAGKSIPDASKNKNVTTVYATPEHGIGAWYHLLTKIYGYGQDGALTILALAKKYAGEVNETADVKSYVAGWRKFSGNALDGTTVIPLNDMAKVLLLARGMYGNEAGGASPLTDAQITTGVALYRQGKLPAK